MGRRREVLAVEALLMVTAAAGSLGQTWGLERLEISTVGFITGLFVVFTPLLAHVIKRKPPGRLTVLGTALFTAGFHLLRGGVARFDLSDLLVLLSAVAFAAQILAMEAGVNASPTAGWWSQRWR